MQLTGFKVVLLHMLAATSNSMFIPDQQQLVGAEDTIELRNLTTVTHPGITSRPEEKLIHETHMPINRLTHTLSYTSSTTSASSIASSLSKSKGVAMRYEISTALTAFGVAMWIL
ncbi:uncharacterized protein PRCAT00006273001 [Priceomyces carsonii]|uniref:uncharacterized protein n=1 Tax=Priceomyces carsonii TaxID=28549 RepID=UPI002ED7DBE7|nr:unnamed protein product [Priceomyces carsonii]